MVEKCEIMRRKIDFKKIKKKLGMNDNINVLQIAEHTSCTRSSIELRISEHTFDALSVSSSTRNWILLVKLGIFQRRKKLTEKFAV